VPLSSPTSGLIAAPPSSSADSTRSFDHTAANKKR